MEDYVVEEKVPIQKKPEQQPQVPADGQQAQGQQGQPQTQEQQGQPQGQEQAEPDYEIKQKKKQRISDLKNEKFELHGYTKKDIDNFFETEAQMMNQDRVTHETYEKKNELESYIYNMRSRLNGELKQYVIPDVHDKALKELKLSEEWLYGEGSSTTKKEYMKRIEILHNLCEPVARRYTEYQQLPAVFQDLRYYVQEYENAALSKDPKLDHITQEERNKVLQECEKVKDWVLEVGNLQQDISFYQDPEVTIYDVKKQQEDFVNKCKQILNKPRPEPKKEQPSTKMEEEKPATQESANQGSANQEAGSKDSSKMEVEQ